jgi:membrane fusion protein (multidrug efflux system)
MGGLVLVLALASCEQKTAEVPPAAARPEVSVVTLHARSVAITAQLAGRTSASQIADVRPQVSGIIQSRLFKEGSEVAAGDALYQIDPSSYQAAYDSAAAALQKAQAAIPTAQAKAGRYQQLIKTSAVSQQDYDDALATLAQAKADVASAAASVEAARINLAFTKVTAPIGGRVDASTVTAGALVTAQQTTALTTIRKLDPINVDVTESSTNLLAFRKAVAEGRLKTFGPNVAVKLNLETGTTYDQAGKLQFATANIEPTTGSFTVRAEFPNPERLLLPGMYVRAEIEEGVAPNSILVPQRAVTYNSKGEATAKFIGTDGKVADRVLTVRQNIGNNWLVDGGVADGDKIIVEGGQLVRTGSEANAIEVTVDDATGDIRALEGSPAAGSPIKTPDPAPQDKKS